VRIYSKQGFIERVTATGFRVDALSAENVGADAIRMCGIAKNSVLYVVQKI
jgi:hypothetical protein